MASSPKIDNWALGIILYSMVFGVYPFDGKGDDEILGRICKEAYTFPKNISVSKTCKCIITQLLDKRHNNRLDLYDDIFDLWYEEESPDVVVLQHENDEVLKETLSKLTINVNSINNEKSASSSKVTRNNKMRYTAKNADSKKYFSGKNLIEFKNTESSSKFRSVNKSHDKTDINLSKKNK
jgi:serine/threonine protein kinase